MFPFSKGKGAAAAGVGVRAESCRQSVGGAGYTTSDGGGPISRAPLSLTRRRVRLLLSLSPADNITASNRRVSPPDSVRQRSVVN